MEIQWALVLFTVVAGAGAWLFAWSMLQSLLKRGAAPTKLETGVSFVLLLVGGCLSVMHLSHVDRIVEALNRPTSGIFVEAAMIGVMCVVLGVYFVLLVRGSSEKARTAVGVLGMLIGIVFTYACGSSYMMDARPAWTTVALPLAYFGTASAAGAGLNLMFKAFAKDAKDAESFAGILAIVGAVLGAACSAAFCLYAAPWLTLGSAKDMTWAIVMFVALALVAVCGVVAWRKPKGALVLGAGACCAGVVGAIGLRVTMWLIGSPFMDFFMMPLD